MDDVFYQIEQCVFVGGWFGEQEGFFYYVVDWFEQVVVKGIECLFDYWMCYLWKIWYEIVFVGYEVWNVVEGVGNDLDVGWESYQLLMLIGDFFVVEVGFEFFVVCWMQFQFDVQCSCDGLVGMVVWCIVDVIVGKHDVVGCYCVFEGCCQMFVVVVEIFDLGQVQVVCFEYFGNFCEVFILVFV